MPIPHQLQMDARAKALMVHGMSSAVIPQFLTMRSTAYQLWGDIRVGEYVSREFNIFCEMHGIKRELIAPYNSSLSGL